MNSKGFGYQEPHISKGEAARLGRICEAVLNDEPDAPEQLASWMSRIASKLGGKKAWTDWFVHSKNHDLGYAIAAKFHDAIYKLMPVNVRQEVTDKARTCLAEILIDEGLTPGKDFSIGPNNGLMLGEAAIAKLKDQMPPEVWAEWESQGLIRSIVSDPWQAVEKHLGVPFRQNLMTRLSELVEQGRSPNIVVGWMIATGCGVSAQVVGDDEDLLLIATMTVHLQENHPQEWKAIKKCFEAKDFLDGDELLEMNINYLLNVAIAADSSESNGEIKDDYISRKGLERLSLVWRGDTFSIPELIGQLDQYTHRNAA